MEIRVQYTDAADRERLMTEHSNLRLILDEQLFDGNYLTFTAAPPDKVTQLQQQVVTLQSRLQATEDALLELLLSGGMA